ncbi:multiprotein-bridging factor 1 family protein [uncultured Friedmanniella sp.]|uniref:helix-turn-helix domain-containing protein n=1 Tax=uncultured Friedmanniella sp. TaxID=335381 RepID=UPI0035CA1CC5
MDHRRAVTAEDLGRAVRWARQEKGIDQAELAMRCNVSRMTISRLERGEAVAATTTLRALSECGFELAVVPKFSRIDVS